MAYGTLAAIADATKAFAVDVISGGIFQRAKIAFGAEGSATDVSASNPLPVVLSGSTNGAALDASVLATNVGLGALTETAPASDIASSGLNGRLQRIAQRLTALIALLPAALANGRLKIALRDSADADLGVAGNALAMVADGYAKVVASGVITRPANTTAYSSGQIVGVSGGGTSGRFAFAGMARTNGGPVRIDRARLFKSQATALGNFSLYIYRGDPAASGVADAATASAQLAVGNAAAALRLVGRISFDMTAAALGTDGAEVGGIPTVGPAILAAAGAGETALYGVLVATGAYTPASGETFSIILEGYAF